MYCTQVVDDIKVPETTDDLREVECFLKTLELKIQSAVHRTHIMSQGVDQTNDGTTQDMIETQDTTLSIVSSQLLTQRTTAIVTTEPAPQVHVS